MKKICVVVWMAAGLALCAQGGLQNFNGTMVDIEYWAGSGANASVMVIDFGSTSYAFGYEWAESATGLEMLQDISTAGTLDCTTTDHGWGITVDTISYGGNTMGEGGWPNDWLSYWTASDGTDWAPGSTGADTRTLADGDWDGWSRETQDIWPPANEPTVPVPEPGTAALAALGAGILAMRRRREVKTCDTSSH